MTGARIQGEYLDNVTLQTRNSKLRGGTGAAHRFHPSISETFRERDIVKVFTPLQNPISAAAQGGVAR